MKSFIKPFYVQENTNKTHLQQVVQLEGQWSLVLGAAPWGEARNTLQGTRSEVQLDLETLRHRVCLRHQEVEEVAVGLQNQLNLMSGTSAEL
jgi:hypothetical protein